jgi:transcriptional regulator with XRE-family HTH domain
MAYITLIDDIMAVMDYYASSDTVIIQELGDRIRQLRLRKNITQEALAERTLLAVGTIKSMESGKGKLLTLITILRELDALDQLDKFIPPVTISPIVMAAASTKASNTRQRATGTRRKDKTHNGQNSP